MDPQAVRAVEVAQTIASHAARVHHSRRPEMRVVSMNAGLPSEPMGNLSGGLIK